MNRKQKKKMKKELNEMFRNDAELQNIQFEIKELKAELHRFQGKLDQDSQLYKKSLIEDLDDLIMLEDQRKQELKEFYNGTTESNVSDNMIDNINCWYINNDICCINGIQKECIEKHGMICTEKIENTYADTQNFWSDTPLYHNPVYSYTPYTPKEIYNPHKLIPDIKITQYAYKKMLLYAKLADTQECYGWLIKKKEEEGSTITDVFFAPDQDNSPASTEVSGEAVASASKELKDYDVLGWWHSHANMSPVHSITDKNNMIDITKLVAQHNFIEDIETIPLQLDNKDNNLIYKNFIYTIDINSDNKEKLLELIKSIDIKINNFIGFAYSVVVNNRGDNFSVVGTSIFNPSTKEFVSAEHNTPLEILDKDEVIYLDEDKMKEEVKSKIKPKTYTPILQGWSYENYNKEYNTGKQGVLPYLKNICSKFHL